MVEQAQANNRVQTHKLTKTNDRRDSKLIVLIYAYMRSLPDLIGSQMGVLVGKGSLHYI